MNPHLQPATDENRDYVDGNQRVYIRVYYGPLTSAEADAPTPGDLMDGTSGLWAPRFIKDAWAQAKAPQQAKARHELEYRCFIPKA